MPYKETKDQREAAERYYERNGLEQFNVRIPADLKERFENKCKKERLSVRSVIIGLMKEFAIDNDDSPNSTRHNPSNL